MFPKFEELKLAGELPSPSGVGMKVLTLTRQEDYDSEELVKTIESDPALTGRLLKIANSARAAGLEPITTVREATLRLGANTVRNVSLGFSLMSTNRTGVCSEFDYDKSWSESLGRAVAAQALAELTKSAPPADAFICGLLSLTGRLGLASVHPAAYGQVITETQGPGIDRLLAAEQEAFEIDHVQVAAALLIEWGLPEEFGRALQNYLRHGRTVGAVDSLPGVVWGAISIINFLTQPAGARFHELSAFTSVQNQLSLGLEAMESFCSRLVGTWADWSAFLSLPSPEPVKLAVIMADAQRRLAERDQGLEDGPVDEVDEDSEGKKPSVRVQGDLGEHDGEGVQVLAVDDDAVSLRILSRELERRGFSVLTAKDGVEGLDLAMRTSPKLVVTDWQMPRMDGVEMVKALRRWGEGDEGGKGQDLYVIILTGNEKEEQLVEAFEAGADDYVVKPLKPRVLAARLRAGLRVVRLQEALAEKTRALEKSLANEGVRNRQLEKASLTDPLTGLENRRAAMKRIEGEWAKAVAGNSTLSLIMCDIDKFKAVNDTFGHDVGDEVLKRTADCLKRRARMTETVCRLGGEEFLIICSGVDAETAMKAAERLRRAVEKNVIEVPGFNRAVTISMGVAEFQTSMKRADELLKAADVAVYEAKNNGRNRVELASPQTTPS